jgi:hypothetical protein
MSSVVAPGKPPEQSIGHATTSTLKSRERLCITASLPHLVLHHGDDGFQREVLRFWTPEENNASEALIGLKSKLRSIRTNDFWAIATEGLAELLGAQYAFISKRQDIFAQSLDTELPPFGDPVGFLSFLFA